MKRLFLLLIFMTVVATVILYEPASFIVYKIKEPYFRCPLKTVSEAIVIRNDQRGDGEFGAKRRNGRHHTGIDILAPVGTAVYASKSGIAFCGNVPTGYGKYVMIYHPDGFQSVYGHLSGYNIYSTKKVHAGDLIGLVGKTGNASSRSIMSHLHFEILKEGVPQNPRDFMR